MDWKPLVNSEASSMEGFFGGTHCWLAPVGTYGHHLSPTICFSSVIYRERHPKNEHSRLGIQIWLLIWKADRTLRSLATRTWKRLFDPGWQAKELEQAYHLRPPGHWAAPLEEANGIPIRLSPARICLRPHYQVLRATGMYNRTW